MPELRVKDFDFTVDTDWTLTDSGVIESDVLTLPDEVVQLYPWNVRKWAPVMPEVPPASSSYQPVIDQLYYALDGESPANPVAFAQAEFGCYIKRDQLSVGPLDLSARYDSLGGTGLRIRLYVDAGVLKATFYDENDAVQGEVSNLDAAVPINTWVLLRVKLWQGRMYLKIGDRGDEDLNHAINAFTGFQDAGTFALEATGVDEHWFIDGDTDRWPYAAERLTGRAYLTEEAAFTLPPHATALDALDFLYDYTNDADGDNVTENHLYYMLHHNGAWGSWVEVDPGEDLSGVSVDGGDSVRVYLLYTNHVEYRLRPGFSRIRLTYTVDWVEDVEMKEVLKNLAALINADATVSAYDDWHDVEIGLPRWSSPGYWTRCGVVLMPDTSVETGAGVSGGKRCKYYTHGVDVFVYMRLDGEMEDLVIGDDKLLDLTEDVKLAIRMNVLGDTVKKVEVGDTNYGTTIEFGPDSGLDALPGNMVRVEVTSLVFEAGS